MTGAQDAYRHAKAHGLDDDEQPPAAARASDALRAFGEAVEELDEDCWAAPEGCTEDEEESDDDN